MIKTPTGFCNKIDLCTIYVEPPWQSILIHTDYIATLQGKLSSVGNDLVAGSSSASTPNTLAALAVHLQVLIDGSTDPARDTSSAAQIYLEKHGYPQPPRPSAPPVQCFGEVLRGFPWVSLSAIFRQCVPVVPLAALSNSIFPC